jgi:ABC-2 type transport system permease protein
MKKILVIGWKDFTLIWRDRAALVLMLLAPFVLTLGLGFVSGRFTGGSRSGLSDIPIIVVNQDQGRLGQALVDVFNSKDLAGLVAPTTTADAAAARQQVLANQFAAAIILPPGLTASLLADPTTGQTGPTAPLEVYANPAQPVSAAVIQAIVESFTSQVETGRVSAQVANEQLLAHGLVTPWQVAGLGPAIAQRVIAAQGRPLVTIQRNDQTGSTQAPEVDALAIFAPGMALMFLMYTVSYGGRNLLMERNEGTLSRLMTTPTGAAQVLGGKLFGIFLTGLAQVAILVIGSSLLFRLKWGDPLAVAALIVAVTAAATGWGMLLAALARTPAQVGSIGSALMLVFGMLSGAFIPLSAFPGWLQTVAHVSPNAWGLDAFTTLARGGALGAIAPGLGALLAMGAGLFAVAVVMFRRINLLQR